MSLLPLKDESIAHCTGVQKIFMYDVMSVKSVIGEYGNPFLEITSDILVLDTRDIEEKSGVYEWSPRDVNCSTTICMRTVPVVMEKNNIHSIHTSARGPHLVDLYHR